MAMKLFLLLVLLSVFTAGGYLIGSTREKNIYNEQAKSLQVKLAGLQYNAKTNTMDSSIFSCYPLRGDGNCSEQIMNNYQTLNDLIINKCEEALKNNVRVVKQYVPQYVRSAPMYQSTNCYTDRLGVHCTTTGF